MSNYKKSKKKSKDENQNISISNNSDNIAINIENNLSDLSNDIFVGGTKSNSKKSGSKKSESKKSGSKKSGSKKSGSKKSGSKQKRELPPAMKKVRLTNEKITQKLGIKISPALLSYIKQKFRDIAKENISDIKNFEVVEKKTLEIFEEHFNNVGKSKIITEIEKIGEQIKKNRQKK